MKAPLSWLAEHVELPAGIAPREVADALIGVGMEIEHIDLGAQELSGPIVIGRVLSVAPEPQRNGKTINWCQVDVGEAEPRGIVCGAHNFAADDLVVVALPGASLPGDFVISARKTYGHVSDGMICSVRELGIGEDHDGILVVPAGAGAPGADATGVLGLRDPVLDVTVTTDRGYCLSIRGLARELGGAFGVAFHDVTLADSAASIATGSAADGPRVRIEDPAGCDQFTAFAVTGLDPRALTPDWMARRLRQCGMRSISLAVDVTNYVMLETGQPLHAFDATRLRGALIARRAATGERLVTLDGQDRILSDQDMVVADDSGPIALAGVMGGASTEIRPGTTDIVLEAAHWTPDDITRTVRRHRLPSEAARRFERGVDPRIAAVALARCGELLARSGGARPAGAAVAGDPPAPAAIALDPGLPARVAGLAIAESDVVAHLRTVGCGVATGASRLAVQPPSWRPDLLLPADLVEEVVRLAGYHRLPSQLPRARAGVGLTPRQRLVRSVVRTVADSGCVEVLSFPFVAGALNAELGLTHDGLLPDGRQPLRLANPLSADEPYLRTSLLPGLITTAVRNVGRGNRDLALFETGLVFLPPADGTARFVNSADAATNPAEPAEPAERLSTRSRPTPAQLDALTAGLPVQPRRLGAIFCGQLEQSGWWGPGRSADWTDAVELARIVARVARADLVVKPADQAPWHPGRCAALWVDGDVIGYAGELHPRTAAALGLPARSCAMELDLDALRPPGPAGAPVISGYPPALLDIALVAPQSVGVGALQDTLVRAAGPLLESVRLFDAYRDDDRVGAGRRSLAFALTLRAPDRTLTAAEAAVVRDDVVDAAGREHGATLRS